MRKSLVVLVLLAAAVPVFGAGGKPATLSLTTPGATLVGNEYQIDYAAVAGGFDIQVMLNSTDTTGMSSFGVRLDGDPGFVLDAPVFDTYPILNEYNGANGWVNDGGAGAGVWAVAAAPLPMPAPTGDFYAGTIYKGPFTFPPPGGITWGKNGLALTMHISALPPLGDYEIGVIGAGTYVGDSTFANAELSDSSLTVIPLRIVPEPVSALLLLAGLPLLRRRR